MKKLIAEGKIQIQKPVNEVFECIVNPEKMTNYFISNSSGRLESGKTVFWSFPEFPDEFGVKVTNVLENEYIEFDWSGGEPDMCVRITLRTLPDASTLVQVEEGEKDYDEEGIDWVKGQSGGWANFLACLKAYLEYGINLRKGAFTFMKDEKS